MLLMLTVFLTKDALAEKQDKQTKPADRFQQTLDKVNKYSDGAEASADKNLKKLDKIYQLLEKYYKDASKVKVDPSIEAKMESIKRKQEETREKFKEAQRGIKEFKNTDKGLAGVTNQLRVKVTAFINTFNQYRASLLELTEDLKRYSQSKQTDIRSTSSIGSDTKESPVPADTKNKNKKKRD